MTKLRKKLLDFLSGKYRHEGKAMYDAWYNSFDAAAGDTMPGASQQEMERELAKIKGSNARSLPAPAISFVWWRLAASFLILAGAAAVIYLQWGRIRSTIYPVTYSERSTPKGKQLHLQLSEGSQVWLNAETKFRFPEKFGYGSREVYLEGEAYFEVAHDAEHPFVIHTGKLTTTVLGTSFNIRAYADADQEVAVIAGKVSVQHEAGGPSPQIMLTPGYRAILAANGLRQESFEGSEQYTAWKQGRLVFENVLAKDMLVSINRFYNTTIKFRSGSLGHCRITTVLESQSVKEVLDLLSFTLNATYTKEGNVYWIEGQGCN